MNSKLFGLNGNDLLKGCAVAIFGVLIGFINAWWNAGDFHIPTGVEVGAALTLAGKAAVAYILKNLFTDSEGRLFGSVKA